jgi:hypothetical protein
VRYVGTWRSRTTPWTVTLDVPLRASAGEWAQGPTGATKLERFYRLPRSNLPPEAAFARLDRGDDVPNQAIRRRCFPGLFASGQLRDDFRPEPGWPVSGDHNNYGSGSARAISA